MFSDVYQLRAEKFALSIEFENEKDGQPWLPWYGRNAVDAAEIFHFHDEDGPPYPTIRNEGNAGRRRDEKGTRVVVVPRSTLTFAKPPILLQDLSGLTGKHLWVYGGAERLKIYDYVYDEEQLLAIYEAIMVCLRHDPLVVPDSAATFCIAEFFVMFRKEFKALTGWTDDTPIGVLLHAINWGCDPRGIKEGNRHVTVWESKTDLAYYGIDSERRKPIRISATSGHSINCVDEHVCVKMLYDPDDDEWPHTLVHHTTLGALASILANRCLCPGGMKAGNEQGKRRPIFAESVETSSVELAARKGGYAHRPGCAVALFLNLLGLKRACAMSMNRIGICGNGAVVIFKEVPIAQFLRVEVYGNESLPYDIWRHPKVPLEFTACPECASKGINTLVPTGTDICWNSHCSYPISDKGLVQYLRIYGMDEDLTKLSRFFRTHGDRLSPGQQANLRQKLRHQPTDHAVRFGRAVPKGVPSSRAEAGGPVPTERHFSELTSQEKGAKLIKLAKAACRKDHNGIHDPNDISKWLVEPKSRKYNGHTERMHYDLEYKAQCERNGCVDEHGCLAQWVEKSNGDWFWKDYELQLEAEKLKGAGKGKPSVAPASKSSWGSRPQHSQAGRPTAAPKAAQVTWESRGHRGTSSSTAEAEYRPRSWNESSGSWSQWGASGWGR